MFLTASVPVLLLSASGDKTEHQSCGIMLLQESMEIRKFATIKSEILKVLNKKTVF